MKRLRLVASLMAMTWGGATAAGAAVAPRPVEFPAPELPIAVTPLPLNVVRPLFEPPAPPAAPAPAGDAGGPAPPRFATLVTRPLPPVPDVGPLACTLAAFGRASSLFECGIQRFGQGDLRGAREALEGARDRGDASIAAAASVWLGEIALREGRIEPAQREYRQVLAGSVAPDLALHAALGYAWAALSRGDLGEAQRAITQALARVPPQPVALVARFLEGIVALLAGRPADALAVWELVARGAPSTVMGEELLFWRGVALRQLGQPETAVASLDRFLAVAPPSHPQRLDAVAQAGWAALGRGAADEAIRRLLEPGVVGRPDLRPQVHAGLVRAYLALGDFARARDEAQRLLEVPRDPLTWRTLLLLADEAMRRGAFAEAERLFNQVRSLELPAAHAEYVTYRLGEALERQDRVPEAQRQYVTLRDSGRVEALAQRAAYRLGLLALRSQRTADARREAEALLRSGVVSEPPDFREAVLFLAAEAAGRGDDPNRAVALFQLLLREYPASPRAGVARLLLGWARLRDGEPESALREWQEAALASDLEVAAHAYFAIAEVALRQGREPQALDALRGLARLVPSHPRADLVALDRGLLLVRTQAYAEAAQELEALVPRLARSAQEPLLRRALGIARYHLGQYDAAEREFRQAAHSAPAEPSNWLGVGLAALNQGRLAEAEDALNRARPAAAAEVAGSASYGLVLTAVKRRDDALFRERAIALVDRYPTHSRAPVLLYSLVRQALDRGDLDQAEGWTKRLLRDHPRSEYARDALFGLAHAARSRPALARDAYRELVTRLSDPANRAEARLGLAEAALALGAPAEAQQAIEAFVAETPANDSRAPRAWGLLIRAHEAQGQRDRLLTATQTFLARFPGDPLAPAVQLTRGHLLLTERQWEPARRALEAARDAGEPAVAAPAHVWLGELYRARDEHEAAIAAYLGATYLYPDTTWAARGLQGAAQSYVRRQMPREAAIVLRKLVGWSGVEPGLAQWARQALTQLAPITGEDPSQALRRGSARP
jgi:tetratricopeptide (TPR) repeat protein